MKKGKFIVIDGADSCGKATQTALLVAALIEKGLSVEKTDFPQYYRNFFGGLLGKCQSDKDIEFAEISPWLASILYAGDRFESKPILDGWLQAGTHVISDRYVSANQLHQGGKIKDILEREKFLTFLSEMEYGLFKIPKPDLVIYLDVPHEISLKLMKEKGAGEKKAYSQGEIDTVENNALYQLNARESGIKMLLDKTWVRIQCSDGKVLYSKEVIHEMVLAACVRVF